jgi:hypothetical protein
MVDPLKSPHNLRVDDPLVPEEAGLAFLAIFESIRQQIPEIDEIVNEVVPPYGLKQLLRMRDEVMDLLLSADLPSTGTLPEYFIFLHFALFLAVLDQLENISMAWEKMEKSAQ